MRRLLERLAGSPATSAGEPPALAPSSSSPSGAASAWPDTTPDPSFRLTDPSTPTASASAPASAAALNDLARGWFSRLPVWVRPEHLIAQYPHVANRLALCWADRTLASRLLDELLVDQRGGRKGFPPAVAAELKQLHDFYGRAHLANGPVNVNEPWGE